MGWWPGARCRPHSTLVPFWKLTAPFPTSRWPHPLQFHIPTIDESVCLVRLQMDNIRFFFVKKRTNDKLIFARWAKAKSAWASVFRLKWQQIYAHIVLISAYMYIFCIYKVFIYVYESCCFLLVPFSVYVYIYAAELMASGSFRLFAANVKRKLLTSLC
jgi:hypothetical protein